MPWVAKGWEGHFSDSLQPQATITVCHVAGKGLLYDGDLWTEVKLTTTATFGRFTSPHTGWICGTDIWAFDKLGHKCDDTITFVSRRWPGQWDAVWKQLDQP